MDYFVRYPNIEKKHESTKVSCALDFLELV